MPISSHKNITSVVLLIANILLFVRAVYFGRSFQAGAYFSFFSLLFLVLYMFKYKLCIYKVSLFSLFYTLQLVSLFFYYINPLTYTSLSDNAIYDIFNCALFIMLPQLLFFQLGSMIENKNKMLIAILKINIFVVVIGLFIFIFKPFNYSSYLSSIYGVGDSYYSHLRFIGYFDNSMSMGILISVTLTLLLFFYKEVNIYYKLSAPILVLALGMSMQRGSWFSFAMSFFILLGWYTLRKKYQLHVLLIIITCSLFLMFLSSTDSFWIERIIERFSDISSGFDRLYNWESLFDIVYLAIIGAGVGATSHKGVGWFPQPYPDANYIRIFADLGLFGFISFVSLLLSSMFRCIKNRDMILFLMLLIYSVQALFTNVFDLFYVSFLFWLFIGMSFTTNKCSIAKSIESNI